MPREKISIAMATCEGSAFVSQQLQSIADQTRPPDELVISDDASTDETVRKIEAFAQSAPFPVRFESAQDRKGATANFERAISRCQGSLIFLADQDDIWASHKIEALGRVFETQPEVGLAFSNGEIVDENLTSTGDDLWTALFFSPADQERVRAGEAPAIFARRVVAAGTTLAFRADFRDILFPFPDLPSVHDAWIAFIIACLAPCAVVDMSLIQYRLHAQTHIGIRRRGLLEQLRQARAQVARNAFQEESAFFESALNRLQEHAPGLPDGSPIRKLIEEKYAHALSRSVMPKSFWRRLPSVFREWSSGRYSRYGYGWKSAAQDLWLRG
ncbi:glycosyltransferase [Myxococcota bacterium]|nr:glycosyltransferase [Myxococcota bacterium]